MNVISLQDDDDDKYGGDDDDDEVVCILYCIVHKFDKENYDE